MSNKNYICPNCNSNEILDIVYGYPTEETLQAWFKKEIELGGCVIGKQNPIHKCKDCGHQW